MRTLIRILLAVTSLFLIAGGVMFYTLYNSDPAHQEVLDDQTFQEKIADIEIRVENSRVDFVPGTESSTRVVLTGNSNDFSLRTDVTGSRLLIEVADRSRFFLFGFNRSVTLQVYVPENGVASITVDSDNGRIGMKDISSAELVLETDNGQIDLEAVDSDTVTIETDNGSINLANMDADMNVRASNGRIIFTDVTGELQAKANNGRIELITGTLDFPVDFETDNGRIEIRTDNEPDNARIEADVDNGSIDIYGQSSRRVSFGDGEVLIRLSSNNGSIEVE